jgi:hypothetical protein
MHLDDKTVVYVCSFNYENTRWTVHKTPPLESLLDRYFLPVPSCWTGTKEEHFVDLPAKVRKSMFGSCRIQAYMFVIPVGPLDN